MKEQKCEVKSLTANDIYTLELSELVRRLVIRKLINSGNNEELIEAAIRRGLAVGSKQEAIDTLKILRIYGDLKLSEKVVNVLIEERFFTRTDVSNIRFPFYK